MWLVVIVIVDWKSKPNFTNRGNPNSNSKSYACNNINGMTTNTTPTITKERGREGGELLAHCIAIAFEDLCCTVDTADSITDEASDSDTDSQTVTVGRWWIPTE